PPAPSRRATAAAWPSRAATRSAPGSSAPAATTSWPSAPTTATAAATSTSPPPSSCAARRPSGWRASGRPAPATTRPGRRGRGSREGAAGGFWEKGDGVGAVGRYARRRKGDHAPSPPAEAAKRFRVPADLAIELAVGEPEVRQPLALSWDERGRLWVMQYLQYP